MLSEFLVEEDSILPDAPEQVPGYAKVEGKKDMIDGASQSENSTGRAPMTNVKLEDLFNDINDDDDDEFSGSGILSTTKGSRPPEAPL